MLIMLLVLSVAVAGVKPDCTGKGGSNGDAQDKCCECLSNGCYAASTSCRPGWTYFQGSCYAFSSETKTWDNAASSCISQGSHLVEINSASENNWILSQIQAKKLSGIWIGAKEELHRGTWEWATSGDPFNFTDWSTGQPLDPTGVIEDCLEIREQFGWKWNDWECGQGNRHVCETRPLPK